MENTMETTIVYLFSFGLCLGLSIQVVRLAFMVVS